MARHAYIYLLAFFLLFLGACNERPTGEVQPTGTETESERTNEEPQPTGTESDTEPDPRPGSEEAKEADMNTLYIHLQDGFMDDTVVIFVEGEEVFNKEEITTMLLTGKAGSFEVEVEPGTVGVLIEVPTKDLAETILLEISADKYLGISIRDGELKVIDSDEPFGYG